MKFVLNNAGKAGKSENPTIYPINISKDTYVELLTNLEAPTNLSNTIVGKNFVNTVIAFSCLPIEKQTELLKKASELLNTDRYKLVKQYIAGKEK
jgi:hypothetical protein